MGTFYPKKMEPKKRITFYSRFFNTVEIDSTYYALPSERNSHLFAERTPKDFIFHFKAFSLLTKHPVRTNRIGRTLSQFLPKGFDKNTITNPPPDMLDKAFSMFGSALMPLLLQNKLGFVLFQFPPWFEKNKKNLEYILECKKKLKLFKLAIEFRHNSWVDDKESESTFKFLEKNNLTYVSVDEPQFAGGTTMPPLAKTTTEYAYVRFHGRNKSSWFKKGASVSERFNYLYSLEELKEWIPRIKKLSSQTKEVYLFFNNCFAAYPIINARDLSGLLNVLKDKKAVELIDEKEPGLF